MGPLQIALHVCNTGKIQKVIVKEGSGLPQSVFLHLNHMLILLRSEFISGLTLSRMHAMNERWNMLSGAVSKLFSKIPAKL